MKVRTLEYFIALAESRSINEAAQKLYVAQPSLSKALRLLEEEIGVPLFARSKAGIDLTEAGRRILPEAKQIVAYCKGWREMAAEAQLAMVNIYIHASFPNFLLPDIILPFKKKYPGTHINCVVTAIPERYISQDVEKPVLTMFVGHSGEQYRHFVNAQGNPPVVLFRGEYGCLVNRRSPLAKKESVSREELKEFYLVLPELRAMTSGDSSFLSPILEDIIAVVSPAQTIQVPSVDSVIELVRAHPETYALSYYPALNRYEGVESGELVYIPFREMENTEGDFLLFYCKKAWDRHPALRELVSSIQEAAADFLAAHPR